MTITNRIKAELLSADIDYQYALDSYRAAYPNGANFCGGTVSSAAATAYARLKECEARYNALAALTTPKLEHSSMEEWTRKIIDEYNNAETDEAIKAAEQKYYSLYSVRTA